MKIRKMISILTALVLVVCSLTGVITGADEIESLDIVEYTDDTYTDDTYVEDIEAVDDETVDEIESEGTIDNTGTPEEVVSPEFVEVGEDLESEDDDGDTAGDVVDSESTLDTDIESGIEVAEDFTDSIVDDPASAEELAGAAKEISYVVRSWNAETKQVESKTEVCTDYAVITGDTTELSGWYISNSHLELSDRLVVKGTAHIILCDSSTLHCKDGINVSSGNTLNIYCQENESGILYCDADTNDNAAIGADDEDGDCGTINIYGGDITADTDTDGTDGAGIGGGDEGNGGAVTIYGGTVRAKGGKYGAGIGGGDADGKGGNGGTTIIYGGTVTATGGSNAAGIGGGEEGNGGTVEIWGGTVTAVAGDKGAGIGGGDWGDCGTITIKGGKVEAVGQASGAAIGSGNAYIVGGSITDNIQAFTHKGTIRIEGGEVSARFVSEVAKAAAIGSGLETPMEGSIIISGGLVDAVGCDGAAIGASDKKDMTGSITITGGEVRAKSVGAAIGGGRRDGNCTGTITIEGGTIEAMTEMRPGSSIDFKSTPSAIGAGNKDLTESPLVLADGLRVTSGESKDKAAAQAYGDREKGCRMLYVKVAPCTEHVFSEMNESGADESRSLFCALCNEKSERQFHPFVAHSISLAGDIGVVFGLKLTEEEASGKAVDFYWGVYGENMTEVEKSYSSKLEKDEQNGIYLAICPVSVAEMIYLIEASITLDGDVYTDRYAVAQYADVILSEQKFAESYVASENAAGRDGEQRLSQVRDLMKEMMNYGSAAQVQFDRAPGILANRYFVTDNPSDPYYYVPEAVDASMISTGGSSMSEGLDAYGLKYVSSTLVYLSKTSLRHYYRITDQDKYNAVKDSITFNGATCKAIAKDNMIYFELPNISASDLDTLYTLKIGEREYKYSALDYVKMCLETAETSESLKELAKATYRYNKAANKFLGE